jgi:hypothetical protein
MSLPNPFSTSNVLEHVIAPKIISGSSGYRVAVDVVDIDTVYSRQLGSSTNPIALEYAVQIGTPQNPVTQGYFTTLGSSITPVQQVFPVHVGTAAVPATSGFFTTLGSAVAPVNEVFAIEVGTENRPVYNGYFNDIGSTGQNGAPVDNLYVKNIYWDNFIPGIPGAVPGGSSLIEGGTGITVTPAGATYIVSSNITGGTGINVSVSDNEYVLSSINTLAVAGGTGISVDYTGDTYTISSSLEVTGGSGIVVSQTGNTFSVSSNTFFVPGTNMVINRVGNAYVFSATGYTGPLGNGLTGPTGNIVYTTPYGIQSTSNVFYDGTVINVPTVQVTTPDEGGFLRLSTSRDNSYIESGASKSNGSGNMLYVSSVGNVAPTVAVDTLRNRVGINSEFPQSTVDVYGQSQITFDQSNGAGGVTLLTQSSVGTATIDTGTYIIHAWGGGGNSNGGIGGAGGYSNIQFSVSSSTNIGWNSQYGGAGGGGNATVIGVTNGNTIVPFAFIPGGGGGQTGGAGAAAGEDEGLPTPEGGFSGGIVGFGTATYDDQSAWEYPVTSAGITGGVFNNARIIGLTSVASSGTTIIFSTPANQSIQGSNSIYTVNPGTTVTIRPSNVVFSPATLQVQGSSASFATVPSGSLGVGRATTATGTGSAVYSNWPTNTIPTIIGPVLINSNFTTSAGNVVWSSGDCVFNTGGATWTFSLNGNFNDIGVGTGNTNLVVTGPTTITTNFNLPGITGQISTDGIVNISGGTFAVASRSFINFSRAASDSNGIGTGGGGFIGGQSAARVTTVQGILNTLGPSSTNRQAGGGAGSWGRVQNQAINIRRFTQVGGSGRYSFINKYNPTGLYGSGGTRDNGGSGWVVIEKFDDSLPLNPALIVNGDVNIGSGMKVRQDGSLIQMRTVNSNGYILSSGATGPEQITLAENCYIGKDGLWRPSNPAGGFSYVACRQGSIGMFTGNAGSIPPGGTANPGITEVLQVGVGYSKVIGNLEVTGNSTFNGTVQVAGTSTLSIGPDAYLANQGGPNILAVVGNNAALSIGKNSVTFNPGSANGGIYAYNTDTFTAQDFIARSDSRIKDNIVTIDSALDKVMGMRGVYYDDKDGTHNVGVIAQEVERVLPEVVHTDENDMKSVSYGRIVGLLIEAIKEQQEIIKKLM